MVVMMSPKGNLRLRVKSFFGNLTNRHLDTDISPIKDVSFRFSACAKLFMTIAS